MQTFLAAVLTAACETMTTLGIFPLRFEADGRGARIVAVMKGSALVERSVGPYSRENLPPEGIALAELISLRWSMRPERPDITLELGGLWPQVNMFLPHSKVEVLYVVPEAAPPGYQPVPGDVTVEMDVKMALEFVARSVDATGEDLPINVAVTYPPDPEAEAHKAQLPKEFADMIPPVIPTVEVDRSGLSSKQRAVHDKALRQVAYSDQKFQALGRSGFSTRIGSVRIQDSQ